MCVIATLLAGRFTRWCGGWRARIESPENIELLDNLRDGEGQVVRDNMGNEAAVDPPVADILEMI